MENFLEEPDNSIFGGRFNDWRKIRVKYLEDIVGKDWFNGKQNEKLCRSCFLRSLLCGASGLGRRV